MTGRRRVFKEDAWRSLEPTQKGLVLGVVAGAVLWAFTGTLSWIAVGVGLGYGLGLLGGRRRARTQQPTPGAPMTTPPRRRPAPRVLTEEERESSLHSSAGSQGLWMVEGKQNRAEALTRMRETVGGFPPKRYEVELDAALAGIAKAREKVQAQRAEFVAEARTMDALNAVFSIHYFNSRHAGHPAEAGLGPIDLVEALGDLCSVEQIEEARARSSALIEDGWNCAYHPDDNGRQVDRLRERHPGFTGTHLHRAADWGYFLNR